MVNSTKKNLLLLTPDAVGGTLLKNVTFFLSQINHDTPLVDAMHLELGKLSLNHDKSQFLKNEEIVHNQPWSEVIDVLESVDFPIISKISHYNLAQRTIDDDFNLFADYLNENFYIISCTRKNLFEHAISWSINNITGVLNIFDHTDKINRYTGYYTTKFRIDPYLISKYLKIYTSYHDWCEKYFNIDSSYCYEDNLLDIENYILNLPIFEDTQKISWYEKFGITFNDWNYCHYQMSNVTELFLQKNNYFLNVSSSYTFEKDENFIDQQLDQCLSKVIDQYNTVRGVDWPRIESITDIDRLPKCIKKELEDFKFYYYVDEYNYYARLKSEKEKYTLPFKTLSNQHNVKNDFKKRISTVDIINSSSQSSNLKLYEKNYQKALEWIESHDCRGIPIKKQTLFDKHQLIENLDECIETYNHWAQLNNFDTISEDSLNKSIKQENQYWVK